MPEVLQDTGGKFMMRQRLATLTDDYWIENEAGQRVYYIDGKLMTIRNRLVFKDLQGNELVEMNSQLVRVRKTMEIKRGGQVIARVQKAIVRVIRDRFDIDFASGQKMQANGNIVDHEYHLEQDGKPAAEVSKHWFRIADTYGIEIQPGYDNVLILAIVVCIDMMTHPTG